MANEGYKSIIDGFLFVSEAEAKQAAKEAEGVAYIRSKTNMEDPEMVLQVYNKMVQQKLFETAVGYVYLKELRDYLYTMPFIEKDSILPIYVTHPAFEQQVKLRAGLLAKQNAAQEKKAGPSTAKGTKSKSSARKGAKNADYKKKFQTMSVICGILAVCVIGMFAITATSNNATILNYENEVINRYEAWEQELTERENAVLESERELGITE